MTKNIVSHEIVLGIHDKIFKLKKGDEIQVFETDKYLRVRVKIQDIEVLAYRTTLERISNPEEKN